MKIKFGTLIVIAMMVICCLADETTKKWTQEEVDRRVANELVKYQHHEDSCEYIEWMKQNGVSDEMLSAGCEKLIRKRIAAGVADDDLYSAMYWYGVHAPQEKLGFFMWIIEHAKEDYIGTRAVSSYYDNLNDKSVFVTNCISYIEKNIRDKQSTRSVMWAKLEKERKGIFRERILVLARKQIYDESGNIFYPDRILVREDPAYKDSVLRIEALKRAVDNKQFMARTPGPYNVIKDIYERLRKR